MLHRFDPFFDFEMAPRRSPRARFLDADVYRVGDRFYLEIDAPGVALEDIDIEVEKKNLRISVERRQLVDDDRADVVRGRAYGSFTRRFFLSEGLDPDAIEASFENGVLTLSVPVSETAKARKIAIEAAPQPSES